MISAGLGILTIGASCVWLWPLTRRALRPLSDNPIYEPLALVAGVGLSLGGLSLLMMWLGLLPGNWLKPEVVLAIPWTGLAISAAFIYPPFGRSQNRSGGSGDFIRSTESATKAQPATNTRLATTVAATVAATGRSYVWLSLICLSGLFPIFVNVISYPFYTYDVLARYAPNARLLFTGQHIPETLTGYPLGVQMLYAAGFMAAGAVNDHFAGIYAGVLAAGMIGIVWVVARLMFSERAAWAAAVLVFSSSVFVNWSTSGYIDIPDGFYHGLAFAFAFLWLRDGKIRYALLTGIFAGLALWVKQSSLVLIPALAVVPLLRLRLPLSWGIVRRELGFGALAEGALLAIAAPWYFRSYLLAGPGGVVPAPSTYDALFVNRSLSALIDFWARRADWGWPFALLTIFGSALWLISFVWPRIMGQADSGADTRRIILLWAAFVIPYHLIWWWQFTYQSRYLLTSLPMYAALAGFAVDWFATRATVLRRVPAWAAVAVSAALVIGGVSSRVGAVYYLVTGPLQSDDVKLTRRATDSWLLAKHVRENAAPGSKLYVMDGSLAYWLYDYELRVGYPTALDELRGYDYYVVAPWGDSVLSALGQSAQEIDPALSNPVLFTELYRSSENGQVMYSVNFP